VAAMNKKICLTIVCVFIALLCACFAWAEDKAVGKVATVVGDADVVRASSKLPLPLAFKDPVYLNDRIKTGVGSQVKILLNDNSILKVGPSSELLIDEMAIGQDEESQSTIELIKGKIRSLIGKRLGSKSEFRIKTSVAVAGVRGTDFEVWAPSSKETLVRCFEGKVLVSHLLPEVEGNVMLTPNTYTEVEGKSPPSASEAIKPEEKIEDKAKKARKEKGKGKSQEKAKEGKKAEGSGSPTETKPSGPESPKTPKASETGDAQQPKQQEEKSPTTPQGTNESGKTMDGAGAAGEKQMQKPVLASPPDAGTAAMKTAEEQILIDTMPMDEILPEKEIITLDSGSTTEVSTQGSASEPEASEPEAVDPEPSGPSFPDILDSDPVNPQVDAIEQPLPADSVRVPINIEIPSP